MQRVLPIWTVAALSSIGKVGKRTVSGKEGGEGVGLTVRQRGLWGCISINLWLHAASPKTDDLA